MKKEREEGESPASSHKRTKIVFLLLKSRFFCRYFFFLLTYSVFYGRKWFRFVRDKRRVRKIEQERGDEQEGTQKKERFFSCVSCLEK